MMSGTELKEPNFNTDFEKPSLETIQFRDDKFKRDARVDKTGIFPFVCTLQPSDNDESDSEPPKKTMATDTDIELRSSAKKSRIHTAKFDLQNSEIIGGDNYQCDSKGLDYSAEYGIEIHPEKASEESIKLGPRCDDCDRPFGEVCKSCERPMKGVNWWKKFKAQKYVTRSQEKKVEELEREALAHDIAYGQLEERCKKLEGENCSLKKENAKLQLYIYE